LLTAAALVVLTVTVAVGSTTRMAAADNGLAISNEITYTLDPDASVVRVQQTIRLTNTVPDRREGNVINRAYFSGYGFSIPPGAQNVVVSSNGRDLGATVTPHESLRFLMVDVEFSRNLFYRSTETLDVRFDLVGSAPRSIDPYRVNAAYAAFEVFGTADPGQLDVRVILPDGFVEDTVGDDLQRTSDGGTATLSALDIADPDAFYVFVTVRDDDRLTTERVKTDSARFDVRAWPGDERWGRFVRATIRRGVPALEEAIGQPWPLEGRVEVREAYTPYLYGYAGWFNASTKELEVGENLDREIVIHELSHAWFNRDLFDDRWMNEGLAQTYSALVVDRIDGETTEPERPGSVRFPLLEWRNPFFATQSEEIRRDEEYGYAASWFVIDALVDEVGEDGMRDIVAAVVDQDIAYVGEGDPESTPSTTADWRRLLDLAEERGDSSEFQKRLQRLVLTEDEQSSLDERSAAREAFGELVEAGGEWAVPYGIRRAMGNWSFVRAEEQMELAHEVLEARDALADAAAELGVTPLASYETEYQDTLEVSDLDVIAEMEADTAAAAAVSAAIAAEALDDGFFGNLGLRDVDLLTPLEDARQAVAAGDAETAEAKAAEVQSLIAGAEQEGKDWFWGIMTIVGAVLGGLLVLLVIALVLRRRRRRRAARQTLARDAEVDAVEASDGAASEPSSEPATESAPESTA
jgi:hypothetical protein